MKNRIEGNNLEIDGLYRENLQEKFLGHKNFVGMLECMLGL
jgi:hypothetical protein